MNLGFNGGVLAVAGGAILASMVAMVRWVLNRESKRIDGRLASHGEKLNKCEIAIAQLVGIVEGNSQSLGTLHEKFDDISDKIVQIWQYNAEHKE